MNYSAANRFLYFVNYNKVMSQVKEKNLTDCIEIKHLFQVNTCIIILDDTCLNKYNFK